jgi:hypothetical protein
MALLHLPLLSDTLIVGGQVRTRGNSVTFILVTITHTLAGQWLTVKVRFTKLEVRNLITDMRVTYLPQVLFRHNVFTLLTLCVVV